MRLLRLAAEGFGPYRERFEIDFAAFEGDGVYLIAGPTGAGKSSILDAIVFALYGSVPRYEREQRVRSDLAGPEDPTSVELDVAIGDRVLRVRRSPDYERPKSRGTGTTTQKATAALLEREGDGWATVATSTREVGAEVHRLVGLSKDEFLQVILLAQGRFARFLHATSQDRKALLRRLFGTHRFDRLRAMLVEDAQEAGAAIEERSRERASHLARVAEELAALEAPDPQAPEAVPDAGAWLGAALETIAAASAAATARAAEAAARRAAADAALDAGRALRDRRARRATAEAERAALAEAEPEVAERREALRAADGAAEAAAAIARADAAAAALARAEAARDAAGEAAGAPGGDAAERHAAAVDLAARLAGLVEREAALPRLERAATAAADVAARAAEHLRDEEARREALPAERDAAVALRARRAAEAADLAPAEAAVAEARGRREARALADRLAGEVRDAAAAVATALEDEAREAAALRDLQARRIAGAAGELAAALVPGEPCAVCGSTEHPSPASSAEAVTAGQVDAAMAAADAAREAHRAASGALGERERALAAAEGRAGDGDAAAVAALVDVAEARVAAARAAADAERAAAAEVAALDARLEGAAGRVAAAAEARDAAAAEAVRARTEADAAQAEVARERAEAASVAERAAAVRAERDALAAWLDALAALERARAEHDDAAAALLAEVEASGFPDEAALRAAALPRAERDALRAGLEAHAAALERVAALLAQPELQALAAEPDLEALGAAAAEARAADEAAAGEAAVATRGRAAAEAAGARARAVEAELAEAGRAAEALRVLAASLDGKEPNTLRMDVETFVLAARLEAIVEAANARLGTMTGGRFSLVHDDAIAYRRAASGLGLQVLDAHTGLPRPTDSLSGGESFLASLALALGLADVVQAAAGGIAIETLFVDEGFGALDGETLEAALTALDALRAGGRSVGVISHVQQMQERIPWRIRVVPVPGGGSRVEVAGR